MRRGFLGRTLFTLQAEDDGGGTGGGGTGGGKVRATEMHDRYNGDAMKLAEKLSEFGEDNYKLRDKVRQLTADLEAAKKSAAPEGGRVLTAEEAKAWEAYQKLGAPDKLDAAVKERDTAAGELATLKRERAVREAAAAEKLNADALVALPGLPPIVVKDEKDGETPVKRAYVVPKEGEQVRLTEYGKQHYAALWPAVEATKAEGDGKGDGKVRVPGQSAGGAKTEPVGKAVASRLYSLPGQKK